jgi:hypothetical protein
MAAKAEKDEVEVPTEFPADQMFVAVSESQAEFAGHDGGPIRGGRGLWAKGTVGTWTSNLAVPLALRDPATGLIWKGYLEPVTKYSYGINGVIVCNESQQYFVEPDGEQAKPKAKPKASKAVAPTTKAAQRAKTGPAPLGASLKKGPQGPLAASVGGRPSDSLVG